MTPNGISPARGSPEGRQAVLQVPVEGVKCLNTSQLYQRSTRINTARGQNTRHSETMLTVVSEDLKIRFILGVQLPAFLQNFHETDF